MQDIVPRDEKGRMAIKSLIFNFEGSMKRR